MVMPVLRRPAGLYLALGLVMFLVRVPPCWGKEEPTTGVDPATRKVVVVVLNGVSWEDIEKAQAPTISSLLQQGSIGLFSTRTFLFRSQAGTFETIGAGSRTPSVSRCQDALSRSERYQGESATALYERLSHLAAGEAAVLVPRISSLLADSGTVRYVVRPGLLGQTLKAAGLSTAVLGNEDCDLSYAPDLMHREIAAIGMTAEGKVHRGDVGKDLLVPDPLLEAATNGPLLAERFEECYRQSSLVVVDLGDTGRALRKAGWGNHLLRQALEREDRNLALLLGKVDWARTRLYLLSPSADVEGPHPLAPIIVYGADVPAGLLTSATTGQRGLVCNIDLLPSILDFLNVPFPPLIYGRQMRFEPSSQDRLADLMKMEANARGCVQARPPLVAFLVFALFIPLALAILSLRCPPLRTVARLGLVIAVGYVFALTVVPILLPLGYGLTPVAVAIAAVALGAMLVPSHRVESLLAALGIVMFAILSLDQLLGTGRTLDTPLGSSSVAALRFYGLGNDLMALLLASSLLSLPLLLPKSRPLGAGTLVSLAILFALITIMVGAPTLGANFGGTLTLGATYVLALFLLARGRIGWEGWITALVVAATFAGALVMLDFHRPAYLRTHLGQNMAFLEQGGASHLLRIIVQKLQLSRRIFMASRFTPLFLPIFLAMLYAVLKPARPFRRLFAARPHFYACLKAAMIGAVIGALTNDSGIIIALIMFSLLAPATFLLALTPGIGEEAPALPDPLDPL